MTHGRRRGARARTSALVLESAAIHGKVWDSGLALVGWLDELLATLERPQSRRGASSSGRASASAVRGRRARQRPPRGAHRPAGDGAARANARANDSALTPRVAPLDGATPTPRAPRRRLRRCAPTSCSAPTCTPRRTRRSSRCALAGGDAAAALWMGHRSRRTGARVLDRRRRELRRRSAARPVPFTPLGASLRADAAAPRAEVRSMRAAAVLSELLD